METKTHAVKCASNEMKYHGDIRNQEPYASEKKDCNCDGYHTFDELYDHRITLYIALCKQYARDRFEDTVWRSKKHSDGELAFGGTWFVLGIGMEKGKQITYHLPIARWDDCYFALDFEKAHDFDGHTSDDVLERLKTL